MITAEIDINELSRRLNKQAAALKLDAPRMMAKEVGELIKTLVRISPPKNLASSKKKSRATVKGALAPIPLDPFRGKQVGNGAHRWLFATPDVLVGVKADDYTVNLNSAAAKKLIYGEKRKASYRLGKRGRQVVNLIGRKIVKKTVFNQVVKRVQNNFGRFKAGWMVGVFRGDIQLTGANKPPAWVTKHSNGVRGDRINGLHTPQNPNFTIINQAKGVGALGPKVASAAVKIRIGAIVANSKRILAGQKEYQY